MSLATTVGARIPHPATVAPVVPAFTFDSVAYHSEDSLPSSPSAGYRIAIFNTDDDYEYDLTTPAVAKPNWFVVTPYRVSHSDNYNRLGLLYDTILAAVADGNTLDLVGSPTATVQGPDGPVSLDVTVSDPSGDNSTIQFDLMGSVDVTGAILDPIPLSNLTLVAQISVNGAAAGTYTAVFSTPVIYQLESAEDE